jgi:hypothetical protein
LEVDQQGQPEAGRFEIVEALRHVFAGEAVHALELDEKAFLDK